MADKVKANGKRTEPVVAEVKPVAVVAQPTEAELKAELDKAYKSGDFKAIAAVARKIDTAVKAKEKSELDAKRTVVAKMEDKVKAAITKAVQPLIDSKQLDGADGIWFTFDFGEAAPTVRLLKSAPKAARAGGGGGGKKFDVSTPDMLARHGSEDYKDGQNYQQAWEASTDKNWRYAIRQKLLKLEGVI